MKIDRRRFIRYAILGSAGAVASGLGVKGLADILVADEEARKPADRGSPFKAQPASAGTIFRLSITEGLVEMVDHTPVYHWAFEDLNDPRKLPRMPGPLISAMERDQVEISVTNTLPDVHGFIIPGMPGVPGNGIQIEPGKTQTLSFTAPKAGSFMYFDPLNAPVNRVLGLHGPMVVLPASGNTPYSDPTPAIQKLFNDLGTTDHFPGEPWVPEHSRIWLFNSIDPVFNEMARRGEAINASSFRDKFIPRYFTINGESGAFASHNHATTPEGRIGQPHLIRIMNAGINTDSPHIHGNHVYLLARRNASGVLEIRENLFLVDTFTDEVVQCMDWLLPLIRPPDIPGDEKIPLRRLIPAELALTLGGVGQSPLMYPMHGHNEQSQSAAGGNYPQGMVAGWIITGDVDGVDFSASNPEERGGPPESH